MDGDRGNPELQVYREKFVSGLGMGYLALCSLPQKFLDPGWWDPLGGGCRGGKRWLIRGTEVTVPLRGGLGHRSRTVAVQDLRKLSALLFSVSASFFPSP